MYACKKNLKAVIIRSYDLYDLERIDNLSLPNPLRTMQNDLQWL